LEIKKTKQFFLQKLMKNIHLNYSLHLNVLFVINIIFIILYILCEKREIKENFWIIFKIIFGRILGAFIFGYIYFFYKLYSIDEVVFNVEQLFFSTLFSVLIYVLFLGYLFGVIKEEKMGKVYIRAKTRGKIPFLLGYLWSSSCHPLVYKFFYPEFIQRKFFTFLRWNLFIF